MSGDGKDDFATRLARIQTKHEQAGIVKPRAKESTPDIRAAKPKESYAVRNFFIWLGIVAVVGSGGYFAAQSIFGDRFTTDALNKSLQSVRQAATSLTSSAPDRRKKSKQPKKRKLTKKLDDEGWVLPTPAVANADKSEVTIADIATGFKPIKNKTSIGGVFTYKTNETCMLRRPTKGEKVFNVRLGYGISDAPVQALSKEQVAEAVTKTVRAYASRKPPQTHHRFDGKVNIIDVFVTDTSAPLYLVLQNLGANILWNVQAAEGVEIAHVAMIGGASGLVRSTDIPGFEAIRISDFVKGHSFGADDTIRPCMVRPWRLPEDHWPSVHKTNKNNDLYKNRMYTYEMGHKAFAAWYQSTLGVDPNINLISADAADHVLIGPVPETPFPYRPLDNSEIDIAEMDHIIFGTAEKREKEIDAIYDKPLLAVTGGDLSVLDSIVIREPS